MRTEMGAGALRLGAAALVVGLLGSAGAGAAMGDPGARRVVADSELKISIAVPLYHGKVKATAYQECEPRRRVTLYRRQPDGTYRSRRGGAERIGTDRTNREGRWKVEAPGDLAAGDRFFAKLRPKDVSDVGTGLSCTGDRSRTVLFAGE